MFGDQNNFTKPKWNHNKDSSINRVGVKQKYSKTNNNESQKKHNCDWSMLSWAAAQGRRRPGEKPYGQDNSFSKILLVGQ